MNTNQESFFDEFGASTQSEWLEEALKKQKDKDLKILQSDTYEGIKLQPFYTREQQVDSGLSPNDFKQPRHWYNAPKIDTESSAQEAISNGADGISGATSAWYQQLGSQVKKFIWLDFSKDLPNSFASNSTIYYDYLSHWTVSGEEIPEAATKLQQIIDKADAWGVNAQVFGQAGSNAVQELAFTLALVTEHLSSLEQAEIAATKMQISLSVGSNYFMEIAKFRALRVLWKLLSKGFGLPASPLFIHAHTLQWNKTQLDIHNNMLRSTTEAMAAVIGGADALTVAPYDTSVDKSSDFSQRIARNISTILSSESHLDKVTDPAAGAYYLEFLTVSLAEKAWQLFQEVEQKGGFKEAFRSGFISQAIATVVSQRKENLTSAKDVLIGSNKYRNSEETSESKASTSQNTSSDLPLLRIERLAQFAEM